MNKKLSAKFYISLKSVIRDKDGRFLVLKSPAKSKYFRGKYDLPGGTIDFNETKTNFHKIIQREIKEECGSIKYSLRPDPVSLSMYQYNVKHQHFYILFEANYLSGKIKISPEHISFKWVKINQNNIKKIFHSSLQKLITNYINWNK